ncbi:peptidyl-tRNA hydrolase [Mobilicoccus pelagius]|nr:peptidyl-tRNA hydrolase [Mobilicoccus pelagius]
MTDEETIDAGVRGHDTADGADPAAPREITAPPGEVLAPVRERYAHWLRLDDAGVDQDRHEDPEQVRAIQIVLHLEKQAPPSRRRALELAARGCALLCLHPRSAPGGPWHDDVAAYGHGHIRKVTRRARGAAWETTADLPGLTLTDDATGTEIRVLTPGLVARLDKRVAKLQVSGTDLPTEDPADPTDVPTAGGVTGEDAPVLTCVVPADLEMTAGKLMAQTGHAGMIAAAVAAGEDGDLLARWHAADCPVRVESAPESRWAELLTSVHDPERAWRTHHRIAVRDAGFTEIAPGTVTVVADLR